MASVDDLVTYILERKGTMTSMKLQKLLYYSQAWAAAMTGGGIFPDPILAYRDGPVVYHVYKQHKRMYHVSRWPCGSSQALDRSERELVDAVLDVYGELSGEDLSMLTHEEDPWRTARGDLPKGAYSTRPIEVSAMKNYYRGRTLGDRTVADLVTASHWHGAGASEDEPHESNYGRVGCAPTRKAPRRARVRSESCAT